MLYRMPGSEYSIYPTWEKSQILLCCKRKVNCTQISFVTAKQKINKKLSSSKIPIQFSNHLCKLRSYLFLVPATTKPASRMVDRLFFIFLI